jgi:hypothetical protein
MTSFLLLGETGKGRRRHGRASQRHYFVIFIPVLRLFAPQRTTFCRLRVC